MSGKIDGHCPTLHHFFIVSLSVFMTLFLLHLHFTSLDIAISGAVCDIHFLKLMHFIWSAKPSQLTSCHSDVSNDITPLAPTMPPQPPPHSLPPPSLHCLKQLQCPTINRCRVIVFCWALSAPLVLSVFHFPIFFLKNCSFWDLFFTKAAAKAQWWETVSTRRAQSARPQWKVSLTWGPEVFWRT